MPMIFHFADGIGVAMVVQDWEGTVLTSFYIFSERATHIIVNDTAEISR